MILVILVLKVFGIMLIFGLICKIVQKEQRYCIHHDVSLRRQFVFAIQFFEILAVVIFSAISVL